MHLSSAHVRSDLHRLYRASAPEEREDGYCLNMRTLTPPDKLIQSPALDSGEFRNVLDTQ